MPRRHKLEACVASHDKSIAQVNDAVAITGVFLGVRDLHDGRAFAVQALEQLHDFFALRRMQIAGRLVREN